SAVGDTAAGPTTDASHAMSEHRGSYPDVGPPPKPRRASFVGVLIAAAVLVGGVVFLANRGVFDPLFGATSNPSPPKTSVTSAGTTVTAPTLSPSARALVSASAESSAAIASAPPSASAQAPIASSSALTPSASAAASATPSTSAATAPAGDGTNLP